MKPRYLICKYKLKNIRGQIAFDKQRHVKLLIEWCDFPFFFPRVSAWTNSEAKKLIRRSSQLIIEITKYFKYFIEIEIVIETDEINKYQSFRSQMNIIIIVIVIAILLTFSWILETREISNLKEVICFIYNYYLTKLSSLVIFSLINFSIFSRVHIRTKGILEKRAIIQKQ